MRKVPRVYAPVRHLSSVFPGASPQGRTTRCYKSIMVNDPIGDMLAQIKNASLARKGEILLPFSAMKMSVASILEKEGYVGRIEKFGTDPKAGLRITLRYDDGAPVVTDLKRKSKPGMRVYIGKTAIPAVLGGMGISILSTPLGVMTGSEARKRGVGGELLCEVW